MPRSIKKGPFIDESLQRKITRAEETNSKQAIKTWSRRSVVLPDFVGITMMIHSGKKFQSVFITENMVGHKLGEFAATRTFRSHGSATKVSVAKT